MNQASRPCLALVDPVLRGRMQSPEHDHTDLDHVTDALLSLRTDVLVVDDHADGVVELCATLRTERPQTRIVVLTAGARQTAWLALQAGAFSVVNTRIDMDDLASVARAATRGESYLDADSAGLALECLRRASRSHHDPFVMIPRLTLLEDEILQSLASGRSAEEIAEQRRVIAPLVRLHVGYAVGKLHRHTADPPPAPTASAAPQLAERVSSQ